MNKLRMHFLVGFLACGLLTATFAECNGQESEVEIEQVEAIRSQAPSRSRLAPRRASGRRNCSFVRLANDVAYTRRDNDFVGYRLSDARVSKNNGFGGNLVI